VSRASKRNVRPGLLVPHPRITNVPSMRIVKFSRQRPRILP
jgi:hypothetical protein